MAKSRCSYYVIDARGIPEGVDYRSVAPAKRAAKKIPSSVVIRECRPKGRAGEIKRTRVLRCTKGACKKLKTKLPWDFALRKPRKRK